MISKIIFALGLLFWLGAVIFLFRMISQVKPGISLWSKKLQYNPCNVIFQPELLTAQGINERKRLFICIGCFAGVVVLGFVIN